MAGCLQYEGDRVGVDDKGREPRPCYDGPSSSTRRAAPCHQMQPQLIAAQPDAIVGSTVWSVPLHAVSAKVSDAPTAPRLI